MSGEKSAAGQRIREYIIREFLPGEDSDNLQDDTPLITSGIVDSIKTLKLVTFLEETFDLRFAAHEISPDYLDSIETILRTVSDKAG